MSRVSIMSAPGGVRTVTAVCVMRVIRRSVDVLPGHVLVGRRFHHVTVMTGFG
jgi:hypothetical protein